LDPGRRDGAHRAPIGHSGVSVRRLFEQAQRSGQ